MSKLRLSYCKTGKAKYISHLDLMATMNRALLRSGVELKYSSGFNPHPYMSVALPLPVGCGSECELMDIAIDGAMGQEDLPLQINPFLPEGIKVYEAYEPSRKFCEITWLAISGVLYYDKPVTDLSNRLADRFDACSIIISKRTKRGVTDIDIAPFIRDLTFSSGEVISMTAKISAQNPSINPDNLMSALEGAYSDLSPDFASFIRVGILDEEMKKFF